jgi:hypothetical protein
LHLDVVNRPRAIDRLDVQTVLDRAEGLQ